MSLEQYEERQRRKERLGNFLINTALVVLLIVAILLEVAFDWYFYHWWYGQH